MWFKKKQNIKEVKEVKEVKEPRNKMFERLRALVEKLPYLEKTDNLQRTDYQTLFFKSNLGWVLVKLIEQIEDECYDLGYYNLDSSDKKQLLFSIRAYKDSLWVNPLLICKNKLDAKTIDLAIYELEQIVEKSYNQCMSNIAEHEKQVAILMGD